MTTPTPTTNRTGSPPSTKARGSRKIARSLWYGMFLGSLPLTSFSFWIALLIAAFVETRILVVAAAAFLAFGLHSHIDPVVEPIGQFILGHESTQPSLSKLASIPVLQNIEWYNTLVCGYTAIFVVGLPIVYVLKKVSVFLFSGLFLRSKQSVEQSLETLAIESQPLSKHQSITTFPNQESISATEFELVEDVAESLQSTIDVVQTAIEPSIDAKQNVAKDEQAIVEQASRVKQQQNVAPKLSKQQRRKLKEHNKRIAKQTQKQIATNTAATTPRSHHENEKVIIVHPLHETKVQAEPHHFTTQTLPSATLCDQVWQGDLISDGIVQQSSIEDVIETLPAEVAHQVTCEIVASEGTDCIAQVDTSVATLAKPSRRKKLTVKETIIDIIRWKKPESSLGSNQMAMQTNISAIETSTTSIPVSPLHSPTAGSMDTVAKTNDSISDDAGGSPVLTVFTTSMNAEPLPFLLGYLSGTKRGTDKPGGS